MEGEFCYPCLRVRPFIQWSGRRDSNPRPSAPKADALPDCATPRCLLFGTSLIVARIWLGSVLPVRHVFGTSSRVRLNATIGREYGGYSSAAERLTVAQDVVGSIPTSRPN